MEFLQNNWEYLIILIFTLGAVKTIISHELSRNAKEIDLTHFNELIEEVRVDLSASSIERAGTIQKYDKLSEQIEKMDRLLKLEKSSMKKNKQKKPIKLEQPTFSNDM
ncbi:MAG: hypothetical protein U9N59_12890 [Campylobacterota bacterium]|nr:hypothetical protein [Campylobacterota bacterium]